MFATIVVLVAVVAVEILPDREHASQANRFTADLRAIDSSMELYARRTRGTAPAAISDKAEQRPPDTRP